VAVIVGRVVGRRGSGAREGLQGLCLLGHPSTIENLGSTSFSDTLRSREWHSRWDHTQAESKRLLSERGDGGPRLQALVRRRIY
jgi:hypothetical protein